MRRVLAISSLILALLFSTRRAHADEQRAWVRAVPDKATWDRYSKRVGTDELGKFIIDVRTNDIYFIDVNLFNIHADFVLGVLLKLPWTADNIREYNKNYERVKPRFILGYLAHHLKVDRWTYSFWEGDKIDAPTIVRVRKRIKDPFFVKDLAWRPDSPMQEKLSKDVAKAGITVVTNDQIYQAASYQAFNKGTAVGHFKVVPAGTPFESLTFDRHDIVLLQESYPDITVVAGILSTTFSTPLSHVNLRAGAWRIPNAGNKKARELYGKLDGKVVYYEVTDTGMTLREASADEIKAFENRVASSRHVDLPQADLKNARFAMLDRMRAKDVVVYGTKASNLGEIVSANVIAGLAGVARAQDADKVAAESKFLEGKDLMKAGKIEAACTAFARSQELDPQLGTQYNLALCYEKAGKLASAWGTYRKLAQIDTNAGRKQDALKRSAAIGPRLTKMLINLAFEGVPDIVVTRNGEDVTRTVGIEAPVDPGTYTIIASATGYKPFTAKVSATGEGLTVTVSVPTLEKLPAAAVPPPPIERPEVVTHDEPPPSAPHRRRPWLAMSVAGGGLAVAATGLVFGALASSNHHSALDACGGDTICDNVMDKARADGFEHTAKTDATVSTILVGAGGAALVTGVILWLTSSSPSDAHAVTVQPIVGADRVGFAVGGSL